MKLLWGAFCEFKVLHLFKIFTEKESCHDANFVATDATSDNKTVIMTTLGFQRLSLPCFIQYRDLLHGIIIRKSDCKIADRVPSLFVEFIGTGLGASDMGQCQWWGPHQGRIVIPMGEVSGWGHIKCYRSDGTNPTITMKITKLMPTMKNSNHPISQLTSKDYVICTRGSAVNPWFHNRPYICHSILRHGHMR